MPKNSRSEFWGYGFNFRTPLLSIAHILSIQFISGLYAGKGGASMLFPLMTSSRHSLVL